MGNFPCENWEQDLRISTHEIQDLLPALLLLAMWIWALHLSTLCFPLHKTVDDDCLQKPFCSPWVKCSARVFVVVTGVTLMACVHFAQLRTVSLYGVHGALHQCLCQAVPTRQCLPALPQCILHTSVCSCHVISGGDWIFCHIPLNAQWYVCTFWVWITVSGMYI